MPGCEAVVVDTVTALLAALAALEELVHDPVPGWRGRPSRCPGWTVDEVVNHSLAVTSKFTAFATGATDAPTTPVGDLVGDDPYAAVGAAHAAARLAWVGVDRTRMCRLPFGTFTAEVAAGINAVDVLAHGWDIGPVGDRRYRCGDEVWRCGLASARLLIGPHRDDDHYGPEVVAGPEADDEVRFLAYLGRVATDNG
jgi:uncharacterized protein (TIGR03086 family)